MEFSFDKKSVAMTKVGQKLLQATFPMATSQWLVVMMMTMGNDVDDGGVECGYDFVT